MPNNKKSLLNYSIILPFGVILWLFVFSQWSSNEDHHTWKVKKQKGVHVFGQLDSVNVLPFVENNYKWITLVSYASQKDYDSPAIVYYRGDSLAMARRDSTWKSQIAIAHDAGFQVFMKPHVWLDHPTNGTWRSDIYPTSDENWESWNKSYRAYILHFAKIAEANNVALFSIGTEFSKLTAGKPTFWIELIKEVREVYSGQLTYAANWHDEYEEITFWNQLDYIGIQAYFPLVKNEYPSVKQIENGWNSYLPKMEAIAKNNERPILFTEMGYKSTSDSAIKPWEWISYAPDDLTHLSLETQAHCYLAFFSKVWEQDWFAGVHIWQTRCDLRASYDPKTHLDFTPQGKPAEKVIANGFEL